MAGNASVMKREVNIIAAYRALIISKYSITVLLTAASLYFGFKRYAMSPLYILLVLNLLPPILYTILKDYGLRKKGSPFGKFIEDSPFTLKLLKEKYKYDRTRHAANSISYLASLLLLLLWHFSYKTANIGEQTAFFPFMILFTGIAIRFLGIAVYLIKIPYTLTHNKL